MDSQVFIPKCSPSFMIKTTTEIVMNALESNMYIRMLGVTTGGGGARAPVFARVTSQLRMAAMLEDTLRLRDL